MSTVNEAIAKEIIKHNGLYPGDRTRVVKVVRYNNSFNGEFSYGLIYEGHSLDYYKASEFVINPVTIWEYKANENQN